MSDKPAPNQPASAVSRYATPAPSTEAKRPAEVEAVGESYDREPAARGPAMSVSLEQKSGDAMCIEYAYRTETNYNADVGIEMYFSTGVKVIIRGQHLRQLYDDLAAHKVRRIREQDALQAAGQVSEVHGKLLPVVTSIRVERGRLEARTGIWVAAQAEWAGEAGAPTQHRIN